MTEASMRWAETVLIVCLSLAVHLKAIGTIEFHPDESNGSLPACPSRTFSPYASPLPFGATHTGH